MTLFKLFPSDNGDIIHVLEDSNNFNLLTNREIKFRIVNEYQEDNCYAFSTTSTESAMSHFFFF